MKRIIYYLLSISVLFYAFACNDDFLKENGKELNGEYTDGALILYSPINSFEEVVIEIPKLQSKDFKVLQYPSFIEFKSFDGKIDEFGKVSFEIKVNAFEATIHHEPIHIGDILLNVKDFGLLDIPVFSLNYGIPRAGASQTSFDFGTSFKKNNFDITNFAEGYLFYSLVEKPEWLKLQIRHSDTSVEIGEDLMLSINSSQSFDILPDTTGLASGDYEGEFIFVTSDQSNPVLKFNVKMTVPSYKNPETMIGIEGKVVDAAFDKNTNTLIYITRSPSKLIAFNVESKTKSEISLSKNPQRVILSADNHQILLAENEQIEIYERSTLNRINKFTLPFIVTHLADGENGFIYFSNTDNELFSLNLSDGTFKQQSILVDGYNNWVISGNELLKFKGKPLLYLSNNRIGGEQRLFLIDCSTPDKLKYINHWGPVVERRTSLSEDQKYLFISESPVYSAPDEHTGDKLYELANLSFNEYHIKYKWIHHSQSNSSVWGSYEYYNQDEYANQGRILQFNDQTFDLINSFDSNKYAAIINGKKDYYDTVAHFVFATADGKQLVLIKNVTVSDANMWHLEFIDL